MLNRVMLIGRLGKDPELRETTNGTAVANFSMATSRRYKLKDGTKQEDTEWHQLVAWGKQAETLARYVSKGDLLCVEGRLATSSWEDKQSGQKRFKTEIVVENFTFMPNAKGGESNGGGGNDFDDDIPF